MARQPPLPCTVSTLESLASSLGETGKDGETNSMLALRAIANAFCTRKGESALKAAFPALFSSLARNKNLLNKNGRVALASVVLKCVVILS
jgi:hypothetical protein